MKTQIFVLAAIVSMVCALDNGYGRSPGMGHDLDYQNPSAPGPGRGNASYVESIADFFVTPSPLANNKTPRELGYWFIETDSGWYEMQRASNGSLVPDPTKYPAGLQPVISYLKARNISFGLYGDRGTETCDNGPGQLGHEKQDAEYFASLGIAWFKEDSCHASGDEKTALAEYGAMRDALNSTGFPIWFALCGWETFYAPPNPSLNYSGGHSLGNSARIGPDTGSGWQAVMTNVENALSVAQYAGATENGGYWNDGSLLLNPGMGCPSERKCSTKTQCSSGQECVNGQCTGGSVGDENCMTTERHRSMFSMWCVLALNLVMTGNLPLIAQVQPFVMETWLNEEAIQVNQDPTYNGSAGLYTKRVDDAALTWPPPAFMAECGGEPDLQTWTFNDPVNEYIKNNASDLCLSIADCQTEGAYDSCQTDPKTHTCAGIGKYPHFEWTLASNGSLLSQLKPNFCATVGSDRSVIAQTCSSNNPLQQWTHTDEQQLVASGLCLTAPSPNPPAKNNTMILARPLINNAWAAVFLNDQPQNATITCSNACFAAMRFPPNTLLTVRDLYQHATIATANTSQGFSAHIPANGSSIFVTFTPQ